MTNTLGMLRIISVFFIISFLTDAASASDVRSMLNRKMKYLSSRQAVISKNIANVNTPGYRAEDIKPVDFKRKLSFKNGGIVMKTTSPKHISYKRGSYFKVEKASETYETAPDKNNVVLEEQLVKMNNIDMEYQNAVTIMHKFNSLLKIALGDISG